jgi:hypothetical protein
MSSGPDDAIGARTTWAYTTEALTYGRFGAGKGKINRATLDELLNAKGAEGWELVHTYFDMNLDGEKDGHLLIFRRPA